MHQDNYQRKKKSLFRLDLSCTYTSEFFLNQAIVERYKRLGREELLARIADYEEGVKVREIQQAGGDARAGRAERARARILVDEGGASVDAITEDAVTSLYYVDDGCHRLRAALELGLRVVPVQQPLLDVVSLEEFIRSAQWKLQAIPIVDENTYRSLCRNWFGEDP